MAEQKNETVRWISLSVGLFDDDKIAIIEGMPDGEAIINCWLRLLCMAGKQNSGGYLYVTQNIAYTDEMLSAMWRKKLATVKLAMRSFKDLEMIDIEEDGKIFLNNFMKWQEPLAKIQENREATRVKVANWRANKKLLMPSKEESTKEEDKNNTLHNITIQCNGNSNGNVTVTQPIATRSPIATIPQSSLAILREHSFERATMDFLGANIALIRPFMALTTFASGKDLNSLLTAFARVYEANGEVMPTSFDEILTLAKRWKPKTDALQKTGLGRWIENRGWENRQDQFKAEAAKIFKSFPSYQELKQAGANDDILNKLSDNYDFYKEYWKKEQPTMAVFIRKVELS